jgi:hypothetical protein
MEKLHFTAMEAKLSYVAFTHRTAAQHDYDSVSLKHMTNCRRPRGQCGENATSLFKVARRCAKCDFGIECDTSYLDIAYQAVAGDA